MSKTLKIRIEYGTGSMMSSQIKQRTCKLIDAILAEHQARRALVTEENHIIIYLKIQALLTYIALSRRAISHIIIVIIRHHDGAPYHCVCCSTVRSKSSTIVRAIICRRLRSNAT